LFDLINFFGFNDLINFKVLENILLRFGNDDNDNDDDDDSNVVVVVVDRPETIALGEFIML